MCSSAVQNTLYRRVEKYQIPYSELSNIKYKNLYFSWMCHENSDAVQELYFTLPQSVHCLHTKYDLCLQHSYPHRSWDSLPHPKYVRVYGEASG